MRILLLSILLFPSFGYCQTSKLKSIIDISEFEVMLNRLRAIAFEIGKVETISLQTIPLVIEGYITNSRNFTDTDDIENAKLIVKHKDKLKEYCDGAESRILYELPDSASNIVSLPIGFASFNNKVAFYQNGLLYDKSLNTIRLSPNDRLRHVMNECIIPHITKLKSISKISELGYIALIANYMAKDFTDDNAISTGETLVMIFTKDSIIRYLNLEITDKELISTSSAFGSTGGNDLVKVSLN